jgi:hypothetical protein
MFIELERDLELERRKVRELQDGSRERDKEYTKLKVRIRSSLYLLVKGKLIKRLSVTLRQA